LLIYNYLTLKKNQKKFQNPILDQTLFIFCSFDKSVTLTHKDMANMKLKFEDFQDEKLSKNQQKMVRGGDETTPAIDPVRTGSTGQG
jgi:hypothetical protein